MSTPTPSKVTLPVKNKQIEELLLWRDPKKSGIALAGSTVVFLFVQFARFNAISLSAYLLISLILGCFLWNNIASLTHKPPVPVPRVVREGISEQEARDLAVKGTVYVNKGLAYVHRLAAGRDAALTGAAIGVLYVAAKLTARISLVGLAYAVVATAFSLPKVYELKKDDIDRVIEIVRKQATIIYDKYLHKYASMIPRASTAKPAESSTLKKEE